ncbi:MAG: Na+/H+ antiporter NhaA [Cytophagaceae bacterium]|nr:Na+/H+ antiporter NhaA [Cytophagaceae bacterium]
MLLVKKKIKNLIQAFIQAEQSSGIILIACTILSLVLANSPIGDQWHNLWHFKFGPEDIGLSKSFGHWINDGLMTIFFLLVGLEIKREIIEGELSSFKKSSLPIMAAIGGMIVPAIIYTAFNWGRPTSSGWGIPMATDIAFALGVLAIIGKGIPFSLKVMLTALAIVDDLGAIIVIALFYTADLNLYFLFSALGVFILLMTLNLLGVRYLTLYIFLGVFLWYFTLKSGIHATISGVLLAMTIPLGKGQMDSVGEKLQHILTKPVSFIIMPLFALSNTGFVLSSSFTDILQSSLSMGIILGLFLGKPLGIVGFSWLAVKMKISSMPANASWRQLTGIGFLGGIGFTMSIFIALLAFESTNSFETYSKVSILIASLISGIAGYFILRRFRE